MITNLEWIEEVFNDNIGGYIKSLQSNPFELVTLIIDISIVVF